MKVYEAKRVCGGELRTEFQTMERGRRPLSRYTWVVAFLTWLVSTIPLCQNSLNHRSLDCGAFPVGAVYTYVVGLWQFTFKTTANHTTPLLTQ